MTKKVAQDIRFGCFLLTAVLVALLLSHESYGEELPLKNIRLPTGFEISVYATLPNARSMTLSPKGTLFVGSLKEGKIYAVPAQTGGAAPKKAATVAQGLNMPNGVAFRDGALYVAKVNRVLRYDDIESRLSNPPKPAIVNDSFPKERHHGWKFIAFGPDGMLYVPVGAPCNICEPDESRYALISRMKTDGNGVEVIAKGMRNTVGFDWHPATKDLWFTDNGRDELGDDVPPDELNYAPKQGLHFGYPYCHGGDIADPEFAKKHSCSEFIPPARKLGPHVAALGMRFYTGSMFPATYRNQIFIAEHGSWNRSKPIGNGSASLNSMATGLSLTKSLPKVGCGEVKLGGDRWTSWSCRTVQCWSQTTKQGRYTESATRNKHYF